MAGIIWTDSEERILCDGYGRLSKEKLKKLFPSRTWVAVKLHAHYLRLKYYIGVHEHVQGDLSVLLHDSPEAFYWMGFIAADGYFFNNRLRLVLARKDKRHVESFCRFVRCDNHRDLENNSYGVAVQDSFNVPKIVGKFDLQKAKTYHPPIVSWMTGDLCWAFFIGFIDGDGSIGNQSGRRDCLLRIKNHISWQPVLKFFTDFVSKEAGVVPPEVKPNKQGYAEVNIANSMTLKCLKKKAGELKLPVLERKWSKIDQDFVSRREQAIKNRIAVVDLKQQGFRNVEIAKQLGLSQAAISVILKKSKGEQL
jgi:hypothetical protein